MDSQCQIIAFVGRYLSPRILTRSQETNLLSEIMSTEPEDSSEYYHTLKLLYILTLRNKICQI